MQGKTHAVCGSALAIAALAPQTSMALAGAFVGGALGALCPDVDCDSSHAYRGCMKFALMALIVFGAGYATDRVYGTTFLSTLMALEEGHWPVSRIIGLILLVGYLIAGALSAHRTLTHSLVGMAVSALAVYLVAPGIWGAFAIGYASHLALDLLNKQKEQLLWPFGDGFALYFCKSDGAMNRTLLLVGTIALVAAIVLSAPMQALVAAIKFKLATI